MHAVDTLVDTLPAFRQYSDHTEEVALPVMIAVLTYGRTDSLPSTIDALLEACRNYPSASILVVDNNPAGDAGPIVTAAAQQLDHAILRYAHELTPGIAAARNRALKECDCARLLIFIDDDESPTDGWLNRLIGLFQEREPTAIAGPVISEFARPLDPWIAAGGFFKRRRMPTGSVVTVAATNNLLLDIAQVRALDLEFAHRFGLTGGEDTLFTRQLVARGGTILWCDEAVVIDRVPESRLSRQWVLRKAFSMGNNQLRVDVALSGTRPARVVTRLKGAVGGIARLAFGGLRAGVGWATRHLSHRARGMRAAAKGAGMLLGAIGYTHAQYARKDIADRGGRRLKAGTSRGCT